MATVLISFKGPFCFVHYVPSWNLTEFLKGISNYSATQIQLNVSFFSFNKMVKVYWCNDSESNQLIVTYLFNKYLLND